MHQISTCKQEKKIARINRKQVLDFYHLVKDTIRNPRNTVSSRSGARTPVIPTKKAVLVTQKKVANKIKFALPV